MIFDSCIWVGLAAGQVNRQAVIDAAGEAPVFSSVISLGELGFGVESCTDPAERAGRHGRATTTCGSQHRPSNTATRS
ncbi:MAG: hypothetical protein Q8O25_00410 [Sulfurisoma sp.]|nr:hypothetical protein [Sulfurisoma sp.]